MTAFPLIERVRRLAEKATKGPWGTYAAGASIQGIYHPAWIMYQDEERAKIEHASGSGVLCWAAEDGDDPRRDVVFRGGENDEAFIAAMRTDAPALADVAEQALKALPPPDKLELLAVWFEKFDDDRNITDQPEVQNDLYAWAAEIRRVLAESEKPHA